MSERFPLAILSFPCVAALASAAAADDLQLFLFAGQSNMHGSVNVELSGFPSDQPTTINEVLFTQNLDAYLEPWGPVQPRMNENGVRRWAGIELTFGQTLLDAGIDNAAIIKFARNGTSLAGDWEPGGAIRNSFYDFADASITELTEMGHSVNLAGFIWVQGSGDAGNLERANDYDSNLAQFIAEIEGRYGDTTTVLNRYHIDSNRGYVDEIRQSQRELADADEDVYVIHTDDLGLNSDNIHFQDSTELEVGRRLASKWLDATFGLDGDYNLDGVVDAADYAAWRTSLGSLSELASDGDGDGVVDADDYETWRQGFGAAEQGSSVAIPEPAAAWLLTVLLLSAAPLRHGPRRR